MTDITYKSIWDALSAPEKEDACLALWQATDEMSRHVQRQVLPPLSRRLRFRPVFLQRKPPNDLARFLRQVIELREFHCFFEDVLRAWLLSRRGNLIARFLDVPGIPHTDGLIHEEVQIISEEQVRQGIRAIQAEWPPREVAIYLGFQLVHRNDSWRNLPAVLKAEQMDVASILADQHLNSIEEVCGIEEEVVEEPSSLPEDNDEFTTLDLLLIKTVVATAFGEEGALKPDEAEHLVDEIAELNASRHRSLFHRGFVHALLDRPRLFHFPGENVERRVWYFCGVLFGLWRRMKHDECLELLRQEAELTRELINNRKVRCGAILLPLFYPFLMQTGDYGLLRDWLHQQLNAILPEERTTLIIHLHEESASLIRRGKAAEALLFLDVIDESIRRARDLPTGFLEFIHPLNQRKRAQSYQLLGDFVQAESLLKDLVAIQSFEDAPNALSDLALINGGFRSIHAILPAGDDNRRQSVKDALSKGEKLFLEAVGRFGSAATNAHFCLGVLKFLRGIDNASSATDHFKHAHLGMIKKKAAYSERELIDWGHFCLAVSLMETAQPSEFLNAKECITLAFNSGVSFPPELLRRAIEAALLFDDPSMAETIADHLYRTRGKEASQVMWDSEIVLHSRAMRGHYLEMLRGERLPVPERWEKLTKLLPCSLQDQAFDQAEGILDAMEEMALENGNCQKKFIAILENEANYSPAWESEEAEKKLVVMYELEGNYYQAAEILKRHFFKHKQLGDDYHLCLARAVLDHICSYNLDGENLDHLCQMMEEVNKDRPPAGALEKLLKGQRLRVLYIGGNETQEGYADAIRQELRGKYPGLEIQFYFPAWDSSWNVHLEKVKPLIWQSDVIILSYLVRTQFGRHVRAECSSEHPWFACTGKGKQSLKSSIENAAIWRVTNAEKTH